jgi:hypothetical protein
MDAWSFPKYPGKTLILPPDVDLVGEIRAFILANESFLSEADCWLGTWIHPKTRYFYLDISTSRPDLDDARNTALEISRREGRRIVALYHSAREETVYL